MRFGPLVLGVSLVACNTVEQAPAPSAVSMLDRSTFDRCIEPIFIRNCSFNACHGNEGFALRVYSVGKLRAPGTPNTQDARTQPLTQDEHDRNYQSAIAFTFNGPAPDDNWLIRKPLPASAGGFEHVGGAIYTGTQDTCVTQIRAWLSGVQADCPKPGVCQ